MRPSVNTRARKGQQFNEVTLDEAHTVMSSKIIEPEGYSDRHLPRQSSQISAILDTQFYEESQHAM
jgi:hypothetical protein